jgi:hypothetical protein
MSLENLNSLRSLQDQDVAAGLDWWANTSNAAKKEVWDAIQAIGASPLRDVICRFAQVGMSHIAILAEEDKQR